MIELNGKTKMENSKRKSFVKLAESRTCTTIKQIRLIGNLSNKSNYEYIKEDYKKIFSAIDRELRRAKERYDDALNGNGSNIFKL